MKFVVTLPALPYKHFEVDSKDSLWAVVDALRLTVCTKEHWDDFIEQSAKSEFPHHSVSVDCCGNPV